MDRELNAAWRRKHDDPAIAVVPGAPVTLFPTTLEDVIEICARRRPTERIHAAGSHWALSTAAIADTTFVETHQPAEHHTAMGRTLFEVVPDCLNDAFLQALAQQQPPPFDQSSFEENAGVYPVHVQTGKRIFQLYAELDQGDDQIPHSLAVLLQRRFNNPHYLGPWAFSTLGGAGGQTVFGALTTGTHGGDFRFPPIADAVMAMHLVVDGGHHYWIEPETPTAFGVPLTDKARLVALYGQDRFMGNQARGVDNFDVIRDDELFRAVLVSAGRFGIVYSVVLRAVRQYSLREMRHLTTWQAVMAKVLDPTSDLYRLDPAIGTFSSRFLQIAVSVTPHDNFTRNLAGVTKRFNVPLASDPRTGLPSGRAERVGARSPSVDPRIQAHRFQFAGNSHPYAPDPQHPGSATTASFLEVACMNADFAQGVIQEVIDEVNVFIASNGAAIGATIAAVVAAGGGVFLLSLLAALAVIVAILLAVLAALAAAVASQLEPRLGETLNNLVGDLLGRSDPAERAAGLFVWQMIAFKLFSSQQGDHDYSAISYAVMDGHDYLDLSCNVNVDSIEVFFDATDHALIAFVNALLAFEVHQEQNGRAFVGYISLRFTGPSRALIGEQRHDLTCAVEVAGLKDVVGVAELIDFAITLALNPSINGILHWGQRNPSTQAQVEDRFGDSPASPGGSLHAWRAALARVTDNGRLDGFSNAFSRQTGLEVVTPTITSLLLVAPSSGSGQPFTVAWNCASNPPSTTTVEIRVTTPAGNTTSFPQHHRLAGQQQVPAPQSGSYTVEVVAVINSGGEQRQAVQTLPVTV